MRTRKESLKSKRVTVTQQAPPSPPLLKLRVRLDDDVIAWLKKPGPGYQSRMNAILRREMLTSLKTTAK
jgi:uncharacterized protein (DUF4415 family)